MIIWGYSEPAVRTEAEDTEAFKDVDLMLYKVIAFDHFRQKIILIANMFLGDREPETLETEYNGRSWN